MPRWFILFILAAGLGLGGCTVRPDPKVAAELAAMTYPLQAPYGADLDILVQRHGGEIDLINRTPATYRNMQLWLNQQYVGRVPLIQIGAPEGSGGGEAAANRFSLAGFINQHGESFPVGWLLAPEKSATLVLAELFDPATGRRHRLTVAPKP